MPEGNGREVFWGVRTTLGEAGLSRRCMGFMKKQIQLYYDPEDEAYKTLISARNKTYLLEVCYKFSVEFYKCQTNIRNPDSEEVIYYLISMMYLLKQGQLFLGTVKGGGGRVEGAERNIAEGVGEKGKYPAGREFREREALKYAGEAVREAGYVESGYVANGYRTGNGYQGEEETDGSGGGYPVAGHSTAGYSVAEQSAAGHFAAGHFVPNNSVGGSIADRNQVSGTNGELMRGNPALASVMADVEIK